MREEGPDLGSDQTALRSQARLLSTTQRSLWTAVQEMPDAAVRGQGPVMAGPTMWPPLRKALVLAQLSWGCGLMWPASQAVRWAFLANCHGNRRLSAMGAGWSGWGVVPRVGTPGPVWSHRGALRDILRPMSSCPTCSLVPWGGLTQAQVGDGLEVREAAGLKDGLGQPQWEGQ